jgi:serine/threonine-protein kinase
MKECQLCKNCYTDDVETCPNDGMPTAHTINGEPVLEGKYHLEMRLGQGGMGVVYKARHAYLKTYHAIKIILPDLVGNDPQLVTRFRQEALAAAAIRHQNVVGVSDYGVINNNVPFLVMEYVDGESLHDLLTREKILQPEMALDLMTAICAGVGAAHHQGIVHRDLKPLNIMICKDKPSMSQAVKILDFGLAKIKSGELLGSFIQAQTTGLMGSPYYMAPEQWADDEPDSRSDIYSLGVMLFQMLTGDVPFKGSSIPAIMKKHISDPPPSLAEVGARLSPELEAAVLHTLQKQPAQRTTSVEMLVQELQQAIKPIGIHTTSGGALPVSSLRVKTLPPESRVFVDNVAVGNSRNDGWLTLQGIQSGNHHLRISHDGFEDWQADVVCDGHPQQVVAELREEQRYESPAIPRPGRSASSIPMPAPDSVSRGFAKTQNSQAFADKTIQQQQWQSGQQSAGFAQSQPPKRSFMSPVVLALIGFIVLASVAVIGVVGAYFLGFIPGRTREIGNVANSSTPTPEPSPIPNTKTVMIAIPGGTFTMGRSDGRPNEQPEHQVEVKPFKMDKTEVTNAEYYEFVQAAGYKPLPAHWVNQKPLPGQENIPVRFVNLDDVKAFTAWRSKRDGVSYRLPTEEEWEFAARNGAQDNLYPWGDKFAAECAVIEEPSNEPKSVGTKTCADQWGIQDLIGNVFEWTSTPVSLYPGNTGSVKPLTEPYMMIRGGSYFQKSTGPTAITSTFRVEFQASKRSAELGFRLVSAE